MKGSYITEGLTVEDYREGLAYSGSVGDFDRLVADGYSPEEASEMVVNGEV